MHKILQELNLPGSATRPVIVPRKSKQATTDKEIAFQLELLAVEVDHKSSNRE